MVGCLAEAACEGYRILGCGGYRNSCEWSSLVLDRGFVLSSGVIIVRMVCYELFCLARPHLKYAQYFDIMKASALTVLNRGGVLMDIRSFDIRELAYPINRSGTRIEEVRLCL